MRVIVMQAAFLCCLVGCSKEEKKGQGQGGNKQSWMDPTDYKADGGAAPLAVHPIVKEGAAGAYYIFADGKQSDGERQEFHFLQPDQQVGGLRFESATVQPANSVTTVRARFPAADRDKIRAFAAAHPETPFFGLRFESTPAAKKSDKPGYNEVVFWVFRVKDLGEDGSLDLVQPTPEAGNAFAKRLLGK